MADIALVIADVALVSNAAVIYAAVFGRTKTCLNISRAGSVVNRDQHPAYDMIEHSV